MYKEYVSTYNDPIDKRQYTEYMVQYVLKHTYVLLWRKMEDGGIKDKLLGYFSLSPVNLLEVSGKLVWDIYDMLTKTHYLFDVYVFSKLRGKGIGKYLVKKAVEVAMVEHKARRILLYALTDGLSRFYHKNSFTFVKNTVIDGMPMVLLERKCI